ncbi:MAG: hypothetical protein ACO1TE_29155 [Prosthecobacter sp.]
MSPDEINEVAKRHPELFESKCRFLNREQAARVLLDQEAHDKENPPHLALVGTANTATALFNAGLAQLRVLHANVTKARSQVPVEFAELLTALNEPTVDDDDDDDDDDHEALDLRSADSDLVRQNLEQGQRITTLEGELVTMTAQRDSASRGLAEATEAFGLEKHALELRLKAAQDALKSIAAANSLKDAKKLAADALVPSP